MKWKLLAVFIVVSTHFAYAQITDSNALFDSLLVEKTKAQVFVLSVKMAYRRDSPEYKNSEHKYIVAQTAFNNYTKAMIDNYRVGIHSDIDQSAQMAASRAKEFGDYVESLDQTKSKGFLAVFLYGPVLLEIAEKIYTFVTKEDAAHRNQIAEARLRQLAWEDWDKIGASK
jgi:hypothetical protein